MFKKSTALVFFHSSVGSSNPVDTPRRSNFFDLYMLRLEILDGRRSLQPTQQVAQ